MYIFQIKSIFFDLNVFVFISTKIYCFLWGIAITAFLTPLDQNCMLFISIIVNQTPYILYG